MARLTIVKGQLGVAGPIKTGRVTRSKKAQTLKVDPQRVAAVLGLQTIEPVHGQPPAWSENRPDLCDAIPWFRSVQGGVYHSKGRCWGFLVDADCGDRSYIDDEIIITRIGGGCTKDAEGNLVLLKDQDVDKAAAKSVINSQESKTPVGLVIGSGNTILKRKLPHRYNVMDYFLVTDIWFEKMGKKAGLKVRFEKLDLSEKSWWSAKGSPAPPSLEERDFETKPEASQCSTCSCESLQIYNEGWMCLHPMCGQFWKMRDGSIPTVLTFHPRFLNTRTRPNPGVQPHFSLIPDLLSTLKESENDAHVSLMHVAWKGVVCPHCSKCIPRVFWRGWKCTPEITSPSQELGHSCEFESMMRLRPISLRAVVDDFEMAPIKRALVFDSKFAAPEIDDQSLSPYRKLSYRIRGVGSITHFVANKAINCRENGPDALFKDLQGVDLGLRRYRLQQSVVAGTLTAHFAVNYGMPYKYVVSVDSKGFNEASDAILRALGRLTWATEQAVTSAGDQFLPPNELLMLGYLEDMKIGYHDDGESSLGPTIATLSLGGSSKMFIRMKYKYFNGISRARKLMDEDPVLEHCKFEEDRQKLKAQFEAGEISKTTYDTRRHEVLKKGKVQEAQPIVKLELHHGDLIVMHGEKLQKYYEHSVVPDTKLRFALTARYVKPDHIDEHEVKKGEFSLTPDQIYDGK